MSGIQSNIPSVKLPSTSTITANATSTAKAAVSGIKSTAIPKVSVPTVPNAISNPMSNIKAPSIPSFGGMGKAGILANASPNFLKNVVPKLQSMVPAFVPGMTVNFGAISGAISAISAVKGASSMLNQIKGSAMGQLNSMTQNIQGQIDTGKMEDISTLQSIQSQVNSAKQDVNGTIDSAQSVAENSISNVAPKSIKII